MTIDLLEIDRVRRHVRRQPHQLAQSKQRQHLVAREQDLASLAPCARSSGASSIVSLTCASGMAYVSSADAREHRAHDGERERQPQHHRRALPRHRPNVHRAAERADARVHRVDAHAAPRQIRHLFRRREARPREQAQQLVLGEVGLGCVDEPVALRAREHPLRDRCPCRRRSP